MHRPLTLALAFLACTTAALADHKANVRLHKAVLMGDAAKVAEALKDGANPDATIGREAIAIEAIRIHDAAVIKALHAGGVKLDQVTADGWNVINLALVDSGCDPDLVRAALDAGVMPDRRYCPAGAIATRAGSTNVKVAQMLIDAGASVDRFDGQEYSALDSAVQVGSADVVKLLIQKNATSEPMPKCGWTVWHCLAQRPRGDKETAEIAKALKGVSDPNEPSLNQWTPLMYACFQNSLESVKALIDAGASIEGEEGGYALVAAALYANEDILKYLLDKGAPVDTEWGGMTPIIAVFYGSDPVLAARMQRSFSSVKTDSTDSLMRSMRGNAIEKLRLLIAKGADVNATDSGDWTPLAFAAHVWDETYSSKSDYPSSSNREALRAERATSEVTTYIKKLDPVAATKMLLDAGATVNIEDDLNPIGIAATRLDSRRGPLLELLRSRTKAK